MRVWSRWRTFRFFFLTMGRKPVRGEARRKNRGRPGNQPLGMSLKNPFWGSGWGFLLLVAFFSAGRRTCEGAAAYHEDGQDRGLSTNPGSPFQFWVAAQVDRTVRMGTVRGSPICEALHSDASRTRLL